MKLKFKQQNFQDDAVNAIVNLFEGMTKKQSSFTIVDDEQISLFDKWYFVDERKN